MTHKHHRIHAGAAVAAAIAAIGTPAASARPIQADPPPSVAAGHQAGNATPVISEPAIRIVRSSNRGGFDWVDGGIGAAGGLGLSLVALGGALAVSRRNDRRVRRSVSATG